MMENGGEDSLMVKGPISVAMVFFDSNNLGDVYTGEFKNGLKHGKGT